MEAGKHTKFKMILLEKAVRRGKEVNFAVEQAMKAQRGVEV